MEIIYVISKLIPVILVIILSIVAGINARKIGYSGILWFFVSIIYWPFASLYLLASLPNKNLDKRRKQEMRLLQKQLAQRRYAPTGSSSERSRQTISDDPTIRS
ncbi:MAG: hypothetical protein F6K54_11100 [Okeania sp. SIO3B5]|uniref:hypothetical protein n=1 Tax=Okeania sp. SIO3B5 TaxID=2607811 RepID=UPI001400A15B|nr:hypothetical protein [Okeania sp. SIO3B5]NEO53579.1 hypothetical protein [Okeania sp. SIO3B5]